MSLNVGAAALRGEASRRTYRIFVSSTAADLEEYRRKVTESILQLEQVPVAMEFFGARPNTPVAECQRLAASSDALVVIVAQRYGWVPTPAGGGDGHKSITWLEVEAARGAGKPVFTFLFDPSIPWSQLREEDRLPQAKTPAEEEEVRAAIRGLNEFKEYLEKTRTRRYFSTPDNLQAWVATSLASWMLREMAKDLKPAAFGLALLDVRQVHRYLNDAGDFQLDITYTVSNETSTNVNLLLPDSVSFLVPDSKTLENVTIIGCTATGTNARLFSVALEDRSFTPVETPKLGGNARAITRIYWRPKVRPSLSPQVVLPYTCTIATKGTEKAAFTQDGSVAGFATSYATERLSFVCEAPPGYRFDRETIVPFLRVEDGSAVSINDLPPPVLESDDRLLTWCLSGDQVKINVNYLINFRFLAVREAA
jgi:hypothetical protein